MKRVPGEFFVRGTRVAATALLALGLEIHARAEVCWLQPERFAVTPGAILAIELDSATEFGDGAAVPVSRLRQLAGSVAEAAVAIAPPVDPVSGLRFSVTFSRPGVAVLVGDLQPESRRLPHEEVERYLRGIHAPESVAAQWSQFAPDAAWRESRTSRVKAFVRVGVPSPGDRSWTQPITSGLDIVPERDPTAMSRDDELSVRVLRDGKPAPGAVVAFLSRGETREHVVVADGEGRAAARLDADGGWLVQCITVERVRASDRDWTTNRTTLTFELR